MSAASQISVQLASLSSFLEGGPGSILKWFVHVFLLVWHFEIVSLDDNPITVGMALGACVLVIVGTIFSKRISLQLGKKLLPRIGLASGVVSAVQSIVFYLLLAFFVLCALKIVHIPLHIFTFVGGALAIGVGFGSQNIVNNSSVD